VPTALRVLSAAKLTTPEKVPATITPPSSSAASGPALLEPPTSRFASPAATAATIDPGAGAASADASGASATAASGSMSGRPPHPAHAMTHVHHTADRIVEASIYQDVRVAPPCPPRSPRCCARRPC